MFAYVGDSVEDVRRLVSALRKAAEKDTVAEKAHLDDIIHRDGWGFALYSTNRGLTYFRSDRPIFRDEVVLPPTDGKIYALFHARKASRGNAVRKKFSHPFLAETESSFLFLSHNGSLDKERLAKTLDFAGETIDSELALKYLVRRGDLAVAAKDLEDYTTPNSALNLLVLEIGKDAEKVGVLVKQFYRREEGRVDKTRYYELCHEYLHAGEAVFSSTLNDYGFSGEPVGRSRLTSFAVLG